MKSDEIVFVTGGFTVALFTRAWIEILTENQTLPDPEVALFTRAWIEIRYGSKKDISKPVALFTRAWIEIFIENCQMYIKAGRPLHEGVD